MDAKRVRELVETLDNLRRERIKLTGRDPNDHTKYFLYPPVNSKTIALSEKQSGFRYPKSYRSFLALHNGWLGFWPDWTLVGIPRPDNEAMYKDIAMNLDLLPKVVDSKTLQELPEREKTDPNRMLLTNHAILATDFNGSFLIFDRNRIGQDGEPEVAWVHYLQHVERRWSNFEALMVDAIRDTEADVTRLRSQKT